MSASTATTRHPLPRASVADTLATFAEVIAPTLAKGVIIRRPKVMKASERLGLDRRAVLRMQKLRDRYGEGPLMLRIPLRNQALILSPEDVHRVLDGTPDPFSPASAEKRAALAHLEPKVSLISEGVERAERRAFNDEVLESREPVHRMAAHFVAAVEEEMERLLDSARAAGELTWNAFFAAWYATVRRVTFGVGARDDHEMTDMLATLRAAANWAFLHPRRKRLLARFHARVEEHLARAEPGTLAAGIAARPSTAGTAPSHQVAHWLFAFDPAGMASFRTLALLSTHPVQAAQARQEVGATRGAGRTDLPFLRACMLEALRLWPTTPAILRETRAETQWRGGTMPRNTSIVIFAPFFHRDETTLPYANSFHPDLWLEGSRSAGWPLVPFSSGPGTCPAHHLVPMLGSAALACLLERSDFAMRDPSRLDPQRPMPGLLDNATLTFTLRR